MKGKSMPTNHSYTIKNLLFLLFLLVGWGPGITSPVKINLIIIDWFSINVLVISIYFVFILLKTNQYYDINN